MLARRLAQFHSPRAPFVCFFCLAQHPPAPLQNRRYASASQESSSDASDLKKVIPRYVATRRKASKGATDEQSDPEKHGAPKTPGRPKAPPKKKSSKDKPEKEPSDSAPKDPVEKEASGEEAEKPNPKTKARKKTPATDGPTIRKTVGRKTHKGKPKAKQISGEVAFNSAGVSLKEAMLKKKGARLSQAREPKQVDPLKIQAKAMRNVPVEKLRPEELQFKPIQVDIPAVAMLAHGLDRVLFNPGVYRLQDPRSRIYNFDPYLEKIMPPREFDFNAISQYETSSKDQTLLKMAREQDTKFTGSTSSMSGCLVHFHYLLSQWRLLGTDHLSKGFPVVSNKFTKIQKAPSAIILRYKDGVYAIDADKEFDTPNIMSWLGNSLELLLTSTVEDFEKFRRTDGEKAEISSEEHGRCYHYSRLGNVLMRSQLDAHDPRLPGTGVFDLKTRAVVSIRMSAGDHESGLGYQLHYDSGEWESFEREYFDMMRATMLKYSLQVRMGRMDGIFVAYHNVERIFGFQYVPLTDMDRVLHGQSDTCLGDQEFRLSVQLLSEILEKATEKFPKTSIRLHFETRETEVPFMYIFAEPVTEEEADAIQNTGEDAVREFERTVIGIERDDEKSKAEWKEIQARVDEEMEEDEVRDETDDVGDERDGVASVSDEDGRENDLELDDEDEAGIETDEDEQVDNDIEEDEQGEIEVEEVGGESSSEASESSEESGADEEGSETSATEVDDDSTVQTPVKQKPCAGWTLTVRNRVNGAYVVRPEDLKPEDNWSIEYAVTEVPTDKAQPLYTMVKARRNKLLTFSKDQENRAWQGYRDVINKYTQKGRDWRETQDEIDARMGKHMYRPLGPGSDKSKNS